MTSTFSSPPLDVPFTVRDRRRKGFFTVDNELFDHYGALLKAHGLAVYMALARFANQEGTCWPSLATIAKRTGMSRMQVIRELAKLQDMGLITSEHQWGTKGEHRANIYTLLHLPEVVTSSDQGCNTPLLGVVTPSDYPSHRMVPKQHRENKTQKQNNPHRTTRARDDQENNNTSDETKANDGVVAHRNLLADSVATQSPQKETRKNSRIVSSLTNAPPPDSGEPPSQTLERQQSGSSALIALGMTAKVAERLAERYSLERIEEKLGYLDFLQQYQPDKVKNPCGWLRTAIEDDFAAPDGFVWQAAEEQTNEQELEVEQEQTQQEEIAQQLAEAQAQQQQAYRAQLTIAYGTTEDDQRLWQSARQDLSYMGRPSLYALIVNAEILQCTEDTALIGVVSEANLRQLSHPGTHKAIERALTYAGGRSLTPEFVQLPAVGDVCALVT